MKLTEKELNEFPIGTKIVVNYFVPFIKTNSKEWIKSGRAEPLPSKYFLDLGEINYDIYIPTYTEYIPPKPILDDKEKEYLSNVIRPWKSQVKSINKSGTGRYEWIRFFLNGEVLTFPAFKTGTMYRGMKLDREYSLEELGI